MASFAYSIFTIIKVVANTITVLTVKSAIAIVVVTIFFVIAIIANKSSTTHYYQLCLLMITKFYLISFFSSIDYPMLAIKSGINYNMVIWLVMSNMMKAGIIGQSYPFHLSL